VKKRYEVGLEKLATTESSVADMQQELIALQPQLEVSTKETEAAMVVSNPSPALCMLFPVMLVSLQPSIALSSPYSSAAHLVL